MNEPPGVEVLLLPPSPRMAHSRSQARHRCQTTAAAMEEEILSHLLLIQLLRWDLVGVQHCKPSQKHQEPTSASTSLQQ
jgi:hypothetical protein